MSRHWLSKGRVLLNREFRALVVENDDVHIIIRVYWIKKEQFRIAYEKRLRKNEAVGKKELVAPRYKALKKVRQFISCFAGWICHLLRAVVSFIHNPIVAREILKTLGYE